MVQREPKSFAEAEVMLDKDDDSLVQDSDIDSDLKGFARLDLCELIEYEDETEYGRFTDEYIGIKSTIHGNEEGIVLFQEYTDLYNYAIEYSNSDSLNQMSGQYIPVDRVQGNVYKPSSSLFDLIDSYSMSKLSYNFEEFKLEENPLSDKVKTCIKYGYVNYNLDEGVWKVNNSIRMRIMALDYNFASSVGLLSFPFFMMFLMIGPTYVPINIDPTFTLVLFKQFKYLFLVIALFVCSLIPFVLFKIVQRIMLYRDSKGRLIPI